jgi:hypothetical protein
MKRGYAALFGVRFTRRQFGGLKVLSPSPAEAGFTLRSNPDGSGSTLRSVKLAAGNSNLK